MDLTTSFLGLPLRNPILVGASPMADDTETALALEEAGAGGIVLRSLFAEQIESVREAHFAHFEQYGEAFAEAASYFPEVDSYVFGPEQYLDHLRALTATLSIPVIASLNGSEKGEWMDYSRMMEDAGADALELNLYLLATDPTSSGQELEDRILHLVEGVRERTRLPLVVKLSPFFSSLAHFARRLDEAGANALLLFNRFYQPDIDIENQEVLPQLRLSDSSELLLRIRWTAILYGVVQCQLAVTGGVHRADDVIKSVMAGAQVVQVVSRLLREGPVGLTNLLQELRERMGALELENLDIVRGSMSLLKCGNPEALERSNYLKTLHSWKAY